MERKEGMIVGKMVIKEVKGYCTKLEKQIWGEDCVHFTALLGQGYFITPLRG